MVLITGVTADPHMHACVQHAHTRMGIVLTGVPKGLKEQQQKAAGLIGAGKVMYRKDKSLSYAITGISMP